MGRQSVSWKKVTEWEARKTQVCQAFLDCLGEFPPYCPLDSQVIRTVSSADGQTEWIRFRAESDEWITAILVRPNGISCPPVVVVHHGYGESNEIIFDEKEAGRQWRLWGEFPRQGIAILAIDARCHGQRLSEEAPVRVRCSDEWMKAFETEWQWLARKMLIYGSSLQTLLIHDASRAIDYLETRNDIDGQRVGMFGHSLGGTTSWSTAVIDPRVRVVAVSGCLLTYETALRIRRDASWHSWIPGLRKSTSRAELVSTIAPRPLLAIHGEHDFPQEGVEPILNAAAEKYELYNCPEQFRAIVLRCGHMEIPTSEKYFKEVTRWFADYL